MTTLRIALGLALGAGMFILPGPIAAQDKEPRRFASLDALNDSYRQQLRTLESRRIADLDALAVRSTGAEADAVYRELFATAIARDLCSEAQAAAGRCLASASSGADLHALAGLVQVLARADKDEHDRALDDWKALFHRPGNGGPIPAETALAVGEAYLQRLIRDGRYDVARKLCELACEDGAPVAIKEHFEDRMARLKLLGKPAPPIAGNDVDGHPVSLADLKGKVVLVNFWATWCPPCVAAIPAMIELVRKYQDRGFVILGVNVNPMHEDVKEAKVALSVVRRFLVRHRVTWVNLLNGHGVGDLAAAYGIEEIPANFLIDREGKIIALEQGGESLERAVVHALRGAADDRAVRPESDTK